MSRGAASSAKVAALAGTASLALAWAWMALLVFAVWSRHDFPLELEWMEAGSLHQARRVAAGLPVYAAPSPEFVPFLYTPLYPAVVAVLGKVVGIDYATGRAVSAMAMVAIGWAIFRAVRDANASPRHAWVAVGLWASSYVFTFRWLDVARGDALYMALVAWALVWLRRATLRPVDGGADLRAAAVAGLAMALGFWTKQTTASFVLAGGAWTLAVLLGRWRSAMRTRAAQDPSTPDDRSSRRVSALRVMLVFAGTIALIDGVGVLIGQALTDGWLWTYIFELHQSHGFNRVRFTQKTWGMFVHAAPFVVALLAWRGGAGVLARRHRRTDADANDADAGLPRDGWDSPQRYWGWMTVAALLVSALGYSTQWAEPNAFIPGAAVGSIFVASCIAGTRPWLAELLVAAQLVFSLGWEPRYQAVQDHGLGGVPDSYGVQDWRRTFPAPEVVARAERLRSELEAWNRADDLLLAPQRPWWPLLGVPMDEAGESTRTRARVGSMGLNDVPELDRDELRATLRDEVQRGRYARIWLEGSLGGWWWMRRALAENYRLRARFVGADRVRPLVGYMSDAGMVTAYESPQLLLERIEAAERRPECRLRWDFEGPRANEYTTEQSAFGPGSVPSIHGRLPAVGPISGARFLSSAAGRLAERGKGKAKSAWFEMPPDASAIEYRVGHVGDAERLALWLEDEGGERLYLELGPQSWGLEDRQTGLDSAWRGRKLRWVASDQAASSALFVDDICVRAE